MRKLSAKMAGSMVSGRQPDPVLTKRFGVVGCDVYVADKGVVIVLKSPKFGSLTADLFDTKQEFLDATGDYSYLAKAEPAHILQAIHTDFDQALSTRNQIFSLVAAELDVTIADLKTVEGIDLLANKVRHTKRAKRWPHYFHAVVLVFGEIIVDRCHGEWALLQSYQNQTVSEPWIFESKSRKYCNLFKVPYREMVERGHFDLRDQFETVSRLQWKDSRFIEALYNI